jgi:P4 family phage/plasmid primase-like protien
MDNNHNRVLESALDYSRFGWKVLPLHTARDGQCTCGKANCHSPGKHPAVPNGVKDASGDETIIRQWFGKGGDFNIGIATGSACGIVVLDIDPRHGGEESIRHFDIPQTVEVITGSGGRHYYFTLPQDTEIRNSAGKLAPGLDVRGENGYIVAPPSMHVCGNEYRWKTDPQTMQAAPCPAWMTIKQERDGASHPILYNTDWAVRLPQPSSGGLRRSAPIDDTIPAGQRNAQLTSIAGAMRRKGCDRDAILAALVSVNQRRCQTPLAHDELQAIAESVAQYKPQPQDGIILDDDHHDTIAKAFEAASIQKHRHQTETWIALHDKKYRIIDARELKKEIRRFAIDCKVPKKIRTEDGFAWRPERLKVTPFMINGIAEALAALHGVWLSPDITPPCWISNGHGVNSQQERDGASHPILHDTDGTVRLSQPPSGGLRRSAFIKNEDKPHPNYILPLENCLLDISQDTQRQLEPTEDFLTFNYLPIVYEPDAKCPHWTAFLGQIFQKKQLSSVKTEWNSTADDFTEVYEAVADELSISILQEYMGLLLTPITRFQKILGIVGPRRSGKGTIGRIIRALVGKDNVASPTLASLTNEHGLQSLHHKTVALVGDASISGSGSDTFRAVERLKSISGEDSQQINPKGRAYIEVDRLKVRFVIMSNELQKLADPTGALAGRFIYLLTTQSFFGKEDVHLEAKLMAELSGIFNWAVEGLMRLLNRGYFLESAAGLEAKATAEELGSPVIAFVREWCTLGSGKQTRSQDLYNAYKRWCEEAGRSKMGRNRFYEEFQRAYPQCTRVRVRGEIDTNPAFFFTDIVLTNEYRIECL